MKISVIISLITLMFCCKVSFAQENAQILIKVVNDKNEGVHDAVVLINDNDPKLTDENGFVFLSVLKYGAVHITINHLSFMDFDTTIIMPLQTVRLNVKLQYKDLILDEVTVTANPSIIEKQASYITDIYLHENHILALFSDRNGSSIRLFDSLGIYNGQRYSFNNKDNFQKIEKGFLPTSFYLVGSKLSLPFSCTYTSSLNITEQPEVSFQKYQKAVAAIVYYDRKNMIKKEVSNFENYVKLYLYDTHSLERQLLYEMHDRQNEEIAMYNYNKVKAIYLQSFHRPNERDIDYGFAKTNVLEDPNWKGDILDLYVSNAQQLYLIMYQVATQGLTFDVKIRKKDMWVVDNVNRKLVTSPLDDIRLTPFITLPESKKPFTFVQSENLICIENGDVYYYLDESLSKWTPMVVADSKVLYPKRKILLGQYLYILGRSDATTAQNTVMRFKVALETGGNR